MPASYEEPEDWKLFDLHYKGSKQQANAIWLELVGTDSWRAFEVVDNQLRFGRWRVSSDPAVGVLLNELCRQRMEHISAIYAIVADLIEKHTG